MAAFLACLYLKQFCKIHYNVAISQVKNFVRQIL